MNRFQIGTNEAGEKLMFDLCTGLMSKVIHRHGGHAYMMHYNH